MDRRPQPFKPPKAGEAIRESHFRDIADGLNVANEYRQANPSTYLRWAVTCKDFDDSYPTPADFPNAFPFKWIYLRPDATGASFPIQDTDAADDDFSHSPNSTDPDGYVFNRCIAVDDGYSFDGTSKKVLSYIAEDSLILVGHGEGHYWVASQASRSAIVSATCDSPIAAAATGSAGTGGFLARNPVSFTARLLVPNVTTKQLTASSVTFTAWSEWKTSIAALSLLKLSQESAGYWTILGAECE